MTNTLPTVSVIMPMFNQRPDFLRASIESVLRQTYPAIELIVSDNHSTNGASDVMREFDDPRMRVVRPERFLPMVEHFCFAADHAKGDYTSFLPSDDLVEPECFARLVPLLERDAQAVFAFGETAGVRHEAPNEVLYFNRDNTLPTGSYGVRDMLKLMIPFGRNAGWLVGGLVRTEAYHASGGMGRDGVKYSADHALALRLLELGSAVYENFLAGRHRCWGQGEGKTEGNRSQAAVADTVRLYEILETSTALRPHLAGLDGEIKRAKHRKALILSLVLLEAQSLGLLDRDAFHAAKTNVLALDQSAAVRFLLAVAGSSGAAAMGKFRKPARAFYHKIVGPVLNRSGDALKAKPQS